MSQFYRELILDNYQNPQNMGSLDHATHEATEENASCGDSTRIQLLVENNKIKDIKHITEGCAISVATTSLLSMYIIGKPLEAINKLDEEAIMELLGTKLTTSRINCALLPVKALQKAIGQE